MGEDFEVIEELSEIEEPALELKAIDFKNRHGLAFRVEVGDTVLTKDIWAKVAMIAVKRNQICVGFIFGDSVFWESIEHLRGVRR